MRVLLKKESVVDTTFVSYFKKTKNKNDFYIVTYSKGSIYRIIILLLQILSFLLSNY